MRSRLVAILACTGALTLGASGAGASDLRTAPRTITAPSQNDQTVHLHVGDRLKVRLGSSFRRPTTTRPKVLKRIRYAGGYGTGENVTAVFKALARGRADVSSVTDYPCRHTTPPCELAQQGWVVHVIVRR